MRSEDDAPDKILKDGSIYTMDPSEPWVSALALRDGKIVARGNSAAIARRGSSSTEVIDLGGRMVMPGLVDGHAHPTKGAIADLFSCKFPFDASPEAIARRLEDFIRAQPEADWIIGGRWDSGFFERHPIGSPRAWLDGCSQGRAVYLRDDSGHNGWANSTALERLGLRRASPDPGGGRILRDADGEPNGLLLEEADTNARAQLPDWLPGQYRAGVSEMVRLANRYGIIGVVDADATEPLLRAYQEADRAGELTLYVAASISTPFGRRNTPLDYTRIEALRDTYASNRVDTRFAKIYEDGVPTAARTAAMLAPYEAHPDYPEDFRGQLHVDEETLCRDLLELEKRGFTVKLHTAGDRSVRAALDAIESAHRASGRSDLRHELAHAGFIDPVDLPRFRELNAVADLSPYMWYPSPIMNSVREALGKRADRYWPIRDLLESGAPLLAGSDWPAAVASMDPWIGIASMVTRRDPEGRTPGALWPEQAISLPQALEIFVTGGARALRRGSLTGSVEVGKSADLIVLDRNLFAIPPEQISGTEVELTLFAGEVVHRA